MLYKVYKVKDGNQYRIFEVKVDLSKPKCWREGSEYKFNTEYLNSYLEG